MLPPMRQASPPNIFFSVRSGWWPLSAGRRAASCSSYAIAAIVRQGRTQVAPPRVPRLLCHGEGAFHAVRGMRIALVRVGAFLQRHGNRLLADERHIGDFLVDSWTDQVEVVHLGLVLNMQRVGTGLDGLRILAVLL